MVDGTAQSTLRAEAEMLAQKSAFPGVPAGGWGFPFDLGNGVVTRTYSPVQAQVHPWRRDILLGHLDKIFGGRYEGLSVLDLGCCEGPMAAGLYERGVRNVTLVEGREINIEKARFVAKTKGYDFRFVCSDIEEFLRKETATYDIVLFMNVLQCLLNPFAVSRDIGRCTGRVAVYDTALTQLVEVKMNNSTWGGPSPDGFFLREFPTYPTTAGLQALEMWPTRRALEMLIKQSGFSRTQEAVYGADPHNWYSSGEHAMLFAFKE